MASVFPVALFSPRIALNHVNGCHKKRMREEKKKIEEEKGWKWRMNTKSRRRWEYFFCSMTSLLTGMDAYAQKEIAQSSVSHGSCLLILSCLLSLSLSLYLNVSLDFFLVTKERRSLSSLGSSFASGWKKEMERIGMRKKSERKRKEKEESE